MIQLLIKQVVLYNDKIEIHFNYTDGKRPDDEVSSPLGILFLYKNSVVQTGLFLNGYAFSFGKSTLPIPL